MAATSTRQGADRRQRANVVFDFVAEQGAEQDAWQMTAPAGSQFVIGYGGESGAHAGLLGGEKNVIETSSAPTTPRRADGPRPGRQGQPCTPAVPARRGGRGARRLDNAGSGARAISSRSARLPAETRDQHGFLRKHSGKGATFDEEARALLRAGWTKLADASSSTLGPKERSQRHHREDHRQPVVTNDGVTIAGEIHLKDQFENMAAQLVKESRDQDQRHGQATATTTATVIAQAIVREGMKRSAAR